ncbi:MAG TPA: hypothetical protein VHO26_11925 [Propionibacteriaceae bacterium]|nr:hypothetical protein [Propionibacteriaceae bacterium]
MTRSRRSALVRRGGLAALVAAALAPVVARAPQGSATGPSPAALADQARATGLSGWALVDDATMRVHRSLAHQSSWHLWYTPAASLRHGQGRDTQYNLALADVLRRLGLEVEVVHAAWVRGLGPQPWFQRGHLWLRVSVDGHTRDVSASHAANRAGRVPFVAESEVQPARPWTPWVVALGLSPFVVREVWGSMLQRRAPAAWLYRRMDADSDTR